MAQNNAVYPAAGVGTKTFPTCTLGVVSKFDPSSKFREEEEILNEDGTLTYLVGVDQMNEVDVELVMFPNANVPTALTNIAFNFANSSLAEFGNANTSFLIRGEIKVAGNPGKAKRVSFKMMNNSALP